MRAGVDLQSLDLAGVPSSQAKAVSRFRALSLPLRLLATVAALRRRLGHPATPLALVDLVFGDQARQTMTRQWPAALRHRG